MFEEVAGENNLPPITSFEHLAFARQQNPYQITISDPQKHGEGSSAFVSYLVKSISNEATFAVRRRFQDFVSLQKQLLESHPTVIIPPLPDKHRMEYITGDRFSPEFVERRRLSLQSYLQRIARHPSLLTSDVLKKFLQAENAVALDPVGSSAPGAPRRESHVFDNISEVLINAFSKVKKPDERFVEIKDGVSKSEDNLNLVEKLYSRLLKAQSELSGDFSDLGGSLHSLAKMETQMSEPLTLVGNQLPLVSDILREKVQSEDYEFVTNLKEYALYCEQAKDVLKLRDQKQVEHEELVQYLQNHQTDRERTMSSGKSPGITGFFKDKFNDLKGVDPEKARQMRLVRLEAKIQELQQAVQASKQTADAFSEEVIKEIELFHSFKNQDFKTYLRDYVDTQLEYHEKSLKVWDELLSSFQNQP